MAHNRYALCVMTSSSNEPKKMSIEEGLKIAGANFEKGSYHASSTIYTAILKAKPEILIANLRMAEINESFGNYDEAELFYENIIKYHPMDTGFLSGYIRVKIKNGKIQSFYGDYLKEMVQRLHILYVVYKPQRVFGINSNLGASHFQTKEPVWNNQRETEGLSGGILISNTGWKKCSNGNDEATRRNIKPWSNDTPIVHEKNRLAKSTRYSKNALKYYQTALSILSNNETLANSFDTYINEEGKLRNRGYSLRTNKLDEVSSAEFVQKHMASEESEKTVSLSKKGKKGKKGTKVGKKKKLKKKKKKNRR